MMEWWNELKTVNQVFYALAGFFSLVFLWQFISSLIGLAGGEADVEGGADAEADADIDADTDLDVDDIEAHSIEDAAESTVAFRIFSVRAILAFFTLFSWAGALYLDNGKPLSSAIVLGLAWGFGAWVLMALLIHGMRKMAETGNIRLATCVGRRGSVYMDIPAGGQGKIRVLVSGVVSRVSARAAGGAEIRAGTPVLVTRQLDATSVEVRLAETPPDEGNQTA